MLAKHGIFTKVRKARVGGEEAMFPDVNKKETGGGKRGEHEKLKGTGFICRATVDGTKPHDTRRHANEEGRASLQKE